MNRNCLTFGEIGFLADSSTRFFTTAYPLHMNRIVSLALRLETTGLALFKYIYVYFLISHLFNPLSVIAQLVVFTL